MIIKEVNTTDYLSVSKLPVSDYVINPYVGCPHACKYCYACFMKRFTKHDEEWGTFVDIKRCSNPINLKKLENKTIFLSSVTDCYNQVEEKYEITRGILKQLVNANCKLSIATKSKLVIRDIDLLKQMKNVEVAISINTLDDSFRNDMDNASSIEDRLEALKHLHSIGIKTVLFMSPIFPQITDFKAIIDETNDYVDEYWFENLNLRGSYKKPILDYVKANYPRHYNTYIDIYLNKNNRYWENLSLKIDSYCKKKNLSYINFFYHDELVAEKRGKS